MHFYSMLKKAYSHSGKREWENILEGGDKGKRYPHPHSRTSRQEDTNSLIVQKRNKMQTESDDDGQRKPSAYEIARNRGEEDRQGKQKRNEIVANWKRTWIKTVQLKPTKMERG